MPTYVKTDYVPEHDKLTVGKEYELKRISNFNWINDDEGDVIFVDVASSRWTVINRP